MNDESSSSPKLVRDLMSVGVPTCPAATPVIEIVRTLLDKKLEGVVVLDEQGNAIGVVSQDELIQAYSHTDYADLTGEERTTAEDIMREDVPQIPPDIPLTAAAQIMQDQRTRVLYIMHHAGGIEYPAAMLSYRHLLRLMALRDDDDLSDLGIKAERESPLATFIKRRDEARKRALGKNR